jgi:hypothetical protein
MDIAVITQLYYQVYITYQLHVSANAAVAIIGLDTIYQRSYTDKIKHRTIISISVGKGTRSRLHKIGGRVCRW